MGLRFERVKLNNLGILSHFPKLKLIFSRKRNQVVEKVTAGVTGGWGEKGSETDCHDTCAALRSVQCR
jgi:hypothetical protein